MKKSQKGQNKLKISTTKKYKLKNTLFLSKKNTKKFKNP